MNFATEIQTLLREIGPGRMSSTAYDTAWVARLGEIDWKLSNQALEWLCENQLADGSWGAKDVFYYHDRVISTLAAMIALTYRGRRAGDKAQIERGLVALENITSGATRGLAADPNGATVGFEMIAPTLVAEAEKLGIIKQQGERILGKMRYLRDRKMQKLGGRKINRFMTPAFSSEMAGIDNQQILDIENLQEPNGSIANSPSATAYFAKKVKKGDQKAINYLLTTFQGRDGGAPFAAPFNVFERAWSIWNLSLIASSDFYPELQPHLSFLQQSWRIGQGVGFSNDYIPCDSDDTSMTYSALGHFGIILDKETLLNYEDESYFRCYPLEADPSIGANIHILDALLLAGLEKDHPSVRKILNFLNKSCQPEGYLTDKWHISPYYTTSHTIITCKGLDNKLCQKAIDWIIRTQKQDGSWGHFGLSTAEETAYAIQALKVWNNYGNDLDRNIIKKAVHWLQENRYYPYPPLWISKALYCPELVVEATIISSLVLCEE